MSVQLIKFIGNLCILLAFCDALDGTKYSKDANFASNEFEPFRMKKVNVLWEKWKKKVPEEKIQELYKELKIQDKLEAELKKARAENGDEDGSVEAKALENLRDIAESFNLQAYLTAEHFPPVSNEIPTDSKDLNTEGPLKDKKLIKLWKQAAKAGFSEDELRSLKEEFWHQQLKLDELSLLRDHLRELEDMNENSIERFREGKDPATLRDKQAHLEDLHETVQDGFLQLEARSSKAGQELEFKDSRVFRLWSQARKSNMTDNELISFKEELKHFEHRIKKHEFFKEQLASTDDSNDEMYENGKAEKKHKELKKTVSDHAHKVKKLHTQLQEKLKQFTPHTEL